VNEPMTEEVRAAIAFATAALGLDGADVSELAGGVANRSFRVRGGSHDLVLKLAGDAAYGLGASGRSEFALQSLAAANGLAPAVVLADPARGFILSRHAGGRMPSAAEMQQSPLLTRVGAWIAALHALPLPAGLAAVDFGARAAGYLARLTGEYAAVLARELARRRAALGSPARLVPCHHDLHHRNFLDDGRRLVAVDWEYSGPGDPAADLAACIGYHGLGDLQVEALFGGYGDVPASLRARVASLGWIFDCLWYGWNAAAAGEGLAPDPGEQVRLAARLAG
jgi:aminoglycoside phosphotransferase (APT) family kinase protein